MSDVPLLELADGKDPEAFRTIGEVAKAFNLRQHVLRYWEEQFPMLRPLTRAGGRRYYRPADIALVAEISRLLYQEGFTIRGARQALDGWGKAGKSAMIEQSAMVEQAAMAEQSFRPVTARPDAIGDAALVGQLQALRQTLAAALD
jgi:DNA-binding transcriptional MerR regulator